MITVLLATYNGERFLKELIDSLLNQTYKDFKLLIRDDGSSDATAALIGDYAARFPEKISVLSGHRAGGACANFFELITACDDDYVMFCDQDDYWKPEKIEKTLQKMKLLEKEYPNKPILVHGDLAVADENLNIINDSFFEFQQISPERDKLNNLLVQNNVTGCTVMINRRLLQYAKTVPVDCAMHDWWLALLACLFGVTDYINEPLALYRQHGGNEVGAKKAKGMGFIVRKLKTIGRTKANYAAAINQAKQLYSLFGEYMTPEQKEITDAFVSLSSGSRLSKIKTIKKYDFRKNTTARTLGQYLLI